MEQIHKDKVESTLNSVKAINDTSISPFFKDRVLYNMYNQKETIKHDVLSWFTPQLQLVILIGVLVINAFVFVGAEKASYNEDLNTFVENYGLSVSENPSNLNMN